MQYLRYHAINNLHGLYWKQTKNFADPAVTAHVKDSVFEWTLGRAERLGEIMGIPPGHVGVGHILAPGGLGTFLLENTVFKGDMFAAIAGNHHCGVNFGGTGGICTPTFLLKNVDFSEMAPGRKWVQYGERHAPEAAGARRRLTFSPPPSFSPGNSGGNPDMPMYTSGDASLDFAGNGVLSVASQSQAHLLAYEECWDTDDVRYDGGIACSAPLRRLQVWSRPQSGDRQIEGTGAPSAGGSVKLWRKGSPSNVHALHFIGPNQVRTAAAAPGGAED